VFGVLLTGVFESTLDRELGRLEVTPAVRAQIWAQRSKLAAAETGDPLGRQAIGDAFVAGYRVVSWVAAALALASSLSAVALISAQRANQRAK
jgi:hypothetical protein